MLDLASVVLPTHALERTSPKGGEFIGCCIRCGLTDLRPSAALEPCENHKRLSDDGALLAVITAPERRRHA